MLKERFAKSSTQWRGVAGSTSMALTLSPLSSLQLCVRFFSLPRWYHSVQSYLYLVLPSLISAPQLLWLVSLISPRSLTLIPYPPLSLRVGLPR